jgi:D-alanine--poly(phosphoribitol) ligase subunit 1
LSHLLHPFLRSLAAHPGRPAVHDGERVLTYAGLAGRAGRVAEALPPVSGEVPLGAVYAGRGVAAYAAILGLLGSGRGYVPLNPRFPPRRNAGMLARARPDVVVAAREDSDALAEVLALLEERPAVVLTDDLEPGSALPDPPPGDVAYLLFTSGTTGEPQGVPVRHESVCAYLDVIAERYGLGPEDRVSQTFDLTFDLSVHDLFAAWGAGACLYPVPENALSAPGSFLRKHGLTAWFSVPSLAAQMDRLRLLRAGAFPSLRLSLFCGEALPEALAGRWQEAAPGSRVDNLYGPTEATIAFTAFRRGVDEAQGGARNGVVPLGWPLPGQRAKVVDGELFLAGSQVAAGYWQAPERTAERFVRLPGEGDATWFRTGDLVEEGPDGCLHYLGRRDDQVKIRGFRVGLLEIDQVLRQASGSPEALALTWPTREAAEGVVAVLPRGCGAEPEAVLAACRAVLPRVMVPRRVVFVDAVPRNANGKLDRRQLGILVAAEEGS